MEMTDTFKKELSRRVVNSSGSRDFVLPQKPKKMPNASISKRSTPIQVKGWLKSLNFSEITVESLGELNGAQIFTLSKDELRQICDAEGNLVFSKLQIQSNLNEQKSGQELNAVLALRKQKQSLGDVHAF
jgi:epidermal growth factor receptor kinase substrate 8